MKITSMIYLATISLTSYLLSALLIDFTLTIKVKNYSYFYLAFSSTSLLFLKMLLIFFKISMYCVLPLI